MESIEGEGAQEHMRMPIMALQSNKEELQKSKDELLPEWWKEYEAEQKKQDEP